MKISKLILSILVLSLLFTPSLSLAVSSTNEPRVQKQNRSPKTTVTDTPIPSPQSTKSIKQQDRKTFLSSAKLQIITKIYENAKNKLEKRYNYLIESQQKINDKLAKRRAEGKDTTAAVAKLNDIAKYQTSYTTNMAALAAKFDLIKVSANPLTQVSDLRKAVKLVETDLQNMRKVEVEALKLVINK